MAIINFYRDMFSVAIFLYKNITLFSLQSMKLFSERKIKLMRKYVLFTYIFAAPSLANTEPLQLFVGVKEGYQWALDESYSSSNPKGRLFEFNAGLSLTPKWRWDLAYQYHNALFAETTSVNVASQLITSSFRYDWYFLDDVSIYAQLGVGYWQLEKTLYSMDRIEAKGLSPIGTLGVNYHFAPNMSLSASYQYIDSMGNGTTGEYDSHGVLLGLTYTFSKSQPSTRSNKASFNVEQEAVVQQTSPTPHYSSLTVSEVFDFDSTQLSETFANKLKSAAELLVTHPQSQATVIGHTDSTGSEQYNQYLAQKRANKVAIRLIHLGVDKKKIEIKGAGESQPIADNSTQLGREQNRRVDLYIDNIQYRE